MLSKSKPVLALLIAMISANAVFADIPSRSLAQSTWAATDDLGRTMPRNVPSPQPFHRRQVGIFYFLWHGPHGTTGPYDISKIISDPVHNQFGGSGAFHWWGEPAAGYFRSDDPWLQRKNLQMLADAGVDVLLIDVTNGFTYHKELDTMIAAAEDMRAHGTEPPKFAFLAHAAPWNTVRDLYDYVYAPGKARDLWYMWDGKPLFLAPKNIKSDSGEPLDQKISSFFTWRDSWAWDHGQDKWQWIDKYPQYPSWHTDPNEHEEVPVSIAGHPIESIGRSFQSGKTWGTGTEPSVNAQFLAKDTSKGIQFSQQWSRALSLDPEFILVTGWNEWVAQRFTADRPQHFAGHDIQKGDTTFVDEYNAEFSRDAMPMRGGFGDNYYMQLVDGIRQYKGTDPVPVSHGWHKMPLNAPTKLWHLIQPAYLDAAGDTGHRDWDGWGSHHYVDNSGRNDIVESRVACDKTNVYFYVTTTKPITPHTGKNWMQLLICTDYRALGWHGYQFVANSHVFSDSSTSLVRFSDSHEFKIKYRAVGKELRLVIPRSMLGLSDLPRTQFEFHWIDNVAVGPGGSDLVDWWYLGDSAPDGRFNYTYVNVG